MWLKICLQILNSIIGFYIGTKIARLLIAESFPLSYVAGSSIMCLSVLILITASYHSLFGFLLYTFLTVVILIWMSTKKG
jgi:hypothetical protein